MAERNQPGVKTRPDHANLTAFLRQDSFKHIAFLKMLTVYPADITGVYLEDTAAAGALLLLPVRVSSFDRQAYPAMDYIVLLTATRVDLARALLPHIPTGSNLVFKLVDPDMRAIIAEAFPLQRVTAYISYTTPADFQARLVEEVVASAQVDERCFDLYAAQGHSRAEVERYFTQGQAYSFTRYQAGLPIASCFTYQNYGDIYEIGGVYTLPGERRQGHGRAVVVSALQHLTSQRLIPRYQVQETNQPSIQLAETAGLRPFVTIEHWLCRQVKRRDQ